VTDGPGGEPEPDAEALEAGRLLFAAPATFLLSATSADQVPASDLPEVAFAGRSNVGKSSLVNALTGRTTLAKTSATPGRTQTLNFFDLGGRAMLVDLPGYGFAKAPKADVERWTRLTRAYLRGRPQLRRVLLLVDARHGVKANDLEVMTALDTAAVSYQVVLTKADKLLAGPLRRVEEAVAATIARHVAAHPVTITTSSETGQGIAELRAGIAALADTSARR